MMQLGEHKNVVCLYGVVVEPLCLITPFMGGGSLDKFLFQSKIVINNYQMLSFCRDVTRGLAHLHSCELIHRDLAARNVLLDKQWNCRIADFGMSRVSHANANFTKTEIGPLKWMAPEAILSKIYSKKTDVYSLGVTFSEILNREEPYPTISAIKIAVEVIQKGTRPTVPDFIPTTFSDLIWDMYDTSPEKRPDTNRVSEVLDKVAETWK